MENEKKFRIDCDCGDDTDHTVSFWYSGEGRFSYLCVYTSLQHYASVWKRLKLAVKYVLGIDNTFTPYTETVVSKENAVKLKAFLEECLEEWDD